MKVKFINTGSRIPRIGQTRFCTQGKKFRVTAKLKILKMKGVDW